MPSPVIPQPLYVPGGNNRSFDQQLLYALVSQAPNLALGLVREWKDRNKQRELDADRAVEGVAQQAAIRGQTEGALMRGGAEAQVMLTMLEAMAPGAVKPGAPMMMGAGPAVQPMQPRMPEGMVNSMQPMQGAAQQPAVGPPNIDWSMITPDMARAAGPVFGQRALEESRLTSEAQSRRESEVRTRIAEEGNVRAQQLHPHLLESAMWNAQRDQYLAGISKAELDRQDDIALRLKKELRNLDAAFESSIEDKAYQYYGALQQAQEGWASALLSGLPVAGPERTRLLATAGEFVHQGRQLSDYVEAFRNTYLTGKMTHDQLQEFLRVNMVRQTAATLDIPPEYAMAFTGRLDAGEDATKVYGEYREGLDARLKSGYYGNPTSKEALDKWASARVKLNALINAWKADNRIQQQLADPNRKLPPMRPLMLQIPTNEEMKGALQAAQSTWLDAVLTKAGVSRMTVKPGLGAFGQGQSISPAAMLQATGAQGSPGGYGLRPPPAAFDPLNNSQIGPNRQEWLPPIWDITRDAATGFIRNNFGPNRVEYLPSLWPGPGQQLINAIGRQGTPSSPGGGK